MIRGNEADKNNAPYTSQAQVTLQSQVAGQPMQGLPRVASAGTNFLAANPTTIATQPTTFQQYMIPGQIISTNSSGQSAVRTMVAVTQAGHNYLLTSSQSCIQAQAQPVATLCTTVGQQGISPGTPSVQLAEGVSTTLLNVPVTTQVQQVQVQMPLSGTGGMQDPLLRTQISTVGAASTMASSSATRPMVASPKTFQVTLPSLGEMLSQSDPTHLHSYTSQLTSVSQTGGTIHHHSTSPTRRMVPPLAAAPLAGGSVTVPLASQQQRRVSSGIVPVGTSCVNSNLKPGATTVANLLMNPTGTAMQASPLSSPVQRPKRIKLEEKPPANEEIAKFRKMICDHKIKILNHNKENYVEHVTELFFLQHNGNMMDFLAWKRRPSPQLVTYLKANALDSDDEEQTINTEVKVPVPGGTPVAISTTLPAAVTQLTQHGGTPLVPELQASALVKSPLPSSSHQTPPRIPSSPQTPSTESKLLTSTPITLTPRTSLAVTLSTSSVTTTMTPTSVKSHRLAMTSVSPRFQTRQHSISAVYDSTIGSQEEIVERAKQEASVVQRISELRKDGLWSEKRLPKVQEPPRTKAHWDYLLEEMVWLATDFAQERKWKKAAAKKCAKMCQKYHQEQKLREERAEKEVEQKLKRIASAIAKEIKQFWANVEKLVEYKQQSRLEEKRKKALDLHLNFIVDQTEKYSSWLAQGINKSLLESTTTSIVSSVHESRASSPARSRKSSSGDDVDFEPNSSDSDDEETIAKEEEQGLGESDHGNELEMLQKDGEVPLEDLLETLPPEILEKPATPAPTDDEANEEDERDSDARPDDEFRLSSDESVDDDEATMEEQEEVEGDTVDHTQELDELKEEGEMSLEDLLQKYTGSFLDEQGSESLMSDGRTDEDQDDSEEETEEEVSSEDESIRKSEIGIESLLGPVKSEPSDASKIDGQEVDDGPTKEITDIAADAERFQPKGYTYSTAQVATTVPFLLKHQLREYQHIGLDWLVTMQERKLNGILADEMGLGKTIQTIALLAHLACEKGIWGPHLIVVPTSVMLNWEMECKKWCPAFKILTYYGTQKERKQKRQGWTKPNAFHICITSYKLVIQDHQSFRRKRWKYFILDEAQNIKNFKSQRWQLLLNFQSQWRLLLTGTPLQNSLMELWSLMHFLMPNVFQSHRDFKEWFANPLSGMIEGSHEYNESLIRRLHKVLRPFLLRRLKSEVEKQLPQKYEHVIMCRLSKRQRFLYDDFMSQAKTKETLANGNFMSVINVLMQLRKVCNHPNMFEARPTISPFQMEGICFWTSSIVNSMLEYDPSKHVNLYSLNLLLSDLELCLTAFAAHRIKRFQTPKKLIEEIDSAPDPPPKCPPGKIKLHVRTSTAASQGQSGRASPLVPAQQRAASPAPMRALTPVVSHVAGTQVKTILNAPALNQQGIPVSVATTQPQQLSGYTFQLVQQQPQGLPVAQLTPTSTPITVQIQQTQQGPRITVPAGQLAQIPAGFAQIVQTSTGQHILLTSNPQAILQPVTAVQSVAGAGLTLTTATATQVAGNSPSPLTSSSTAPTSATAATPAKSVAAVASTINKPVLRVPPMNVVTTASMNTNATVVPNNKPAVLPTPVKPVARLDTSLEEEKERARSARRYTKSIFFLDSIAAKKKALRAEKLRMLAKFNTRRCEACPIYGSDLIKALTVVEDVRPVRKSWRGMGYIHCMNAVRLRAHPSFYWYQSDALGSIIKTPEQCINELKDVMNRFVFLVPPVTAPQLAFHASHPSPSALLAERQRELRLQQTLSPLTTILHPISSAMATQFPDPRLIEYDCGKLQTLVYLLRRLKSESHRVLIFTQMTRMLDVLEQFLNYHGHIYLRLDGTTRVEQRQALMERFNADRRIFCFILSTRSGGIGVNLTGADTVIFYDSDWNPTMDAQAQDRCHRIGQTRDVHIYRLVSMKSIEENILKKANQKRLLGEVAIEGGNFTTAFFRKNTIHDLFNVDFGDLRKLEEEVIVKEEPEKTAENISTVQLENALANAEEEQDVQATKTAKAEAAAELAEFDESIPYDADGRGEEEVSKVEQELGDLMSQLTPVERYAMIFLESIQEPFSLEQLKQAEEEIEAQKKDWELGRLQALKEEEEERRAQMEENEVPFTYSREDANNQIYISYNGQEQMPMWAPPTPPQDENDVYVDYCMCFLFEPSVMPESQLPPVYVKREHKRLRVDTTSVGRKQKVRKDEAVSVPRSLFDRPTPALTKMRRDAKMQKIRGLPRPPVVCGYKPPAVVNKPIMDTQQDHPEWLIHEDWALLQAVQTLLELPLSLTVLSPAHTPNWDMVAEVVNATGRLYRSPKQCKGRYESVIVPREEGKILYDTNPKKQKKSKGIYRTKNNRPMRTSQLFIQDNNSSFSHLYHMRFETIKSVANKRTPTLKPLLVNPTLKNPKHAAVLAESNINYEQPLTPMQVATIRSERIAREKQKTQAAAAAATAELQLAAHRQQQQQHQAQALAQAQQAAATGGQQVGLTPAQQLQISVATAAASTLTGTATNLGSLCAQRGTTAGVSVRTNPQTVVSLTPAQVQAATQRITAANLAAVTSVSAGVVQTQATTQVATKNLTVQQMQALRTQTLFKQQQQQQQQQRLQRLQQVAQQQQQAAVAAAAQQQGASAAAAVAAAQAQAQKGSVVVSSPLATAAGVTALQVSQAQQRVQVGKQAVKPTRAMSDADLMQLIKRQPKSVTAGTGASVAQIQVPTQGQVTTQLLTHTQLQQMQQQQQAAGQTQVATLVKTVSTPTGLSGSPSVTIPMSAAVSLSIPNVKATVAGSKMAAVTQQSQLRQFQLQQQLLQRKMQQQQQQQQQQSQKVAQLAQQVQGKSQLPTQLGTVQIVQQAAATAQKQLSTVTVQQIQQVIKQVPQQNIQHLSQVTASGGSSLVTQSAAVSSAQIVSHGLLTKPTQATVTLAQTVAPTTVTAALHASSAGQSFTSGQTVQARVIPATSQSGAPIVAASIASPAAAAAAAAAKAAAIKQTIQVVTAAAGSPGLSPAQVQAAQMRGQVSTVGGQPVAVAVRTTTPLQTQHIAAGTSQTLTASQLPTQVPHSAAASVTAPVTLAALVGQNPAGGSVTGAPASQVALQQAKLQAAQQARSSSYTMRLRNPPKQ